MRLSEGVFYLIYEKYMDDAIFSTIPSSPVQRTNNTTSRGRFNSQNNGTASLAQEGQNENNNRGTGTDGGNLSTSLSSASTRSTNKDHFIPFFTTGILILFHFIVDRLKRFSRHVKKKVHHKKRNEDAVSIHDIDRNENEAHSALSSLTVFRRIRRTVCEGNPQGTLHTNSTQGNDDSEQIPLSSSSASSSSWSLNQNASNNTSSSNVQNPNTNMNSITRSNHQGGRTSGFAAFLQGCMRFFMSLGIFLLFVLCLFNHTYIGSKMTSDTPTCLQSILSKYHSSDSSSSTKFLKHDEILQIIVLLDDQDHYDTYCKKYECSKAWRVGSALDSSNAHNSAFERSIEHTLSSPSTWEKPFYRYALKKELLSMSNSEMVRRNVKEINVTVTPHCLSTGSDFAKHPSLTSRMAEMFLSFFSGFVIYDTILLNEVVHGSRTENGEYQDGYFINFLGTKRSWSGQNLNRSSHSTSTITDKICKKISILLFSLAFFFVITSVTAILTQSIALFLDNLLKLSKQSFMELVKNRVLLAHLAKFGITYLMFQASKKSLILSISEYQEEAFYFMLSFFIFVDIFRLIFVRSALSIYFFPKVVLLYYLYISIYIKSTPFGFFHLATFAWYSFNIHAMAFCILTFEVPAFLRGKVSREHPRELNSKIQPSDQNNMHGLSIEWSLFYPLNSRYIPIEDRDE